MLVNLNATVGLSLCMILSGCMTFVEGKKDSSKDNEGVEYSLPIPVIRVTPMPDGTIDVQTEMLPDPDNTYRLKTKSFLSSYTLDISRENGMLTSVSLDAKSDAVAAALLEARANLIKAKAESDAKDRAAVAAAAKEQAKAISDAKMEVVLATAKLKALTDAKAPDADIAAASLAKAVADAKLDALQQSATDAGKSGFNFDKAVVKELPANALLSAAPVLFRVVPVPDERSVRLVAFEGPRFLQTSSAAKKPEKEDKVPNLELKLDSLGVLKKGAPLRLIVVANRPNLDSDVPGSGVQPVGAGDALRPYVLLATPKPDDGKSKTTTFTVTLKDEIPEGSYGLVLRLIDKTSKEPMLADPIPFVVQK